MTRRLAGVLLFAAPLWGCGGHPPPLDPFDTHPVETITLEVPSTSLPVYESEEIVATEKDRNGTVITNLVEEWDSSVPAVATVAKHSGIVTAVSPGQTTITVTCAGKAAQVGITVTAAPVFTLTLNQTASALVTTQQLQLTATLKDALGVVLIGKPIVWTTTSSVIASVSTTGLVTANSPGTATVTATSEGKSASADIAVYAGSIIGSGGGTLSLFSGNVVLTVPPNALSAMTPIFIIQTTPATADPNGFGTDYLIGPGILHFAVPATLKLLFDPTALNPAIPALTTHADMQINGTWTPQTGTTDVPNHSVSFRIIDVEGPVGAAQNRIWFTSDYFTPGDLPGASNTKALGAVSVCAGASAGFSLAGVPPFMPVPHAVSLTLSNSAIAAASLTSDAFMNVVGVAAGTTTIFVFFSDFGTASVDVTVTNCPGTTPLFATLQTGSATDGYSYAGVGLPTVFTTDHEARNVAVGLTILGPGPGGAASLRTATPPPVAYEHYAPPYQESIYWNGITGAATPITMPSSSFYSGAGTFMDNGNFLFAQSVSGYTDIWGVVFGGSTAVQLTNLHGVATGLAYSPDNTVYYDWHPVGGTSHIYRIPIPTFGSTPVTAGATQISTGSLVELNPAVSQNGALLAYAQQDPGLITPTFGRIYVLDVKTAGATPTLITPSTGYAYVPTWCGNEAIYYAYSTSYGGPYQLMKWTASTNTIAAVAAFSGKAVFDLAMARTDGDGGLHVCP